MKFDEVWYVVEIGFVGGLDGFECGFCVFFYLEMIYGDEYGSFFFLNKIDVLKLCWSISVVWWRLVVL